MPPWNESTEAMLMTRPRDLIGDHAARNGLRQKKHGLEIDRHDLVPVRLRELEQVGAADDAGVVDEDVDHAELGLDTGDERVVVL